MENISSIKIKDADETIKTEVPEITVDMYSLNKNFYINATPLSPTKTREGFEKIQRVYNAAKESTYYMLLNNEIKYYTLFHKTANSAENFGDVVKECVEGFGIIKDIVQMENNTFEIWVTNEEKATYCFMLFDYTAGVIEVEG